MLRYFLIFIFLCLSLPTFACWRVEGTFAVDGETFKISQKFEPNQEYSFPMGTFILSLSVSKKALDRIVKYKIEERRKSTLVLVSKGEEKMDAGKTRDIFAKGETGQPNSILSLKLTDI